MIKPWSDRQREAIRAFRKAISERAARERDIAGGAQARQRALEEHQRAELDRVESEFGAAHAGAAARAEHTRKALAERHAVELGKLRSEHAQGKDGILREYRNAKEALAAEFRDARWATFAVFEADKRVAKEEMQSALESSKALLKRIVGNWRTARKLIEPLEFIDDIDPLDETEIQADDADPWGTLQTCAVQVESDLHNLQAMRSLRFINGWKPWLILVAVWLILSAPGYPELFDFWYYWLAGATLVLPVGYALVARLRRQTNDRIIVLWLSLRNAAHVARRQRPICLRLAKKTYLEQKRQSYKHNRVVLREAIAATKAKLHELRGKRNQMARSHERAAKKHVADVKDRQRKEAVMIDTTLEAEEQQAKDRHDVESRLVESEHARRREENHQWHTHEWTSLLRDWKTALDQFLQEIRAVARESEQWFPDWSRTKALPASLPAGLPIGRLHWSLEVFPEGAPAEPQLPRPDLTKVPAPALLAFPRQASLLYRVDGAGKSAAIESLQALLLRVWTALPAGKVRCTIIDPVGRGENFAAFMHLADHDERLVDYRIWTESAQIDERLTNLTVHMENVLQKYLRNQFKTLAEYNDLAGEVAEPFHFLVVAHFPVNFSEAAAHRLVSLASAGARCGINTFVVVDRQQPMPHGFNLADLENVCTVLDWRPAPDERFVWEDRDLGMFPLTLEKMPSAERCTELLRLAGTEAVRSSKVEVPFEWIMPPRKEWWTSDSASGLNVPIGRFGAQGKQLFELGQGTAQHALVAGKTGSGKSTLLHVLIAQLAMHYSPREVELYLVDFKKGVEFKAYAGLSLPHARVIAVESEREFGLSVLEKLDAELSRRGELFRSVGVNDLAAYRAYARQHPSAPALSRTLLIVDEFQEFFIEDDKLAQDASLLLDRLVRQGRAFGMHVLLGSQTIGGAYSLARSTIDQMAVRIALQCSEADAHLILSRDNTEARLLSRPGEGIYNPMHGLLEGNHLFQVVWLGENKRDDILKQVHDLGRQHADFPPPIVFEGAAPADMATNRALITLWREPPRASSTWHAWLGDAIAIKDPTSAVFRKQSGSNVLVLGQQEEPAVGMLASSLISLSAAGAALDLVMGQALEASNEAWFRQIADILPIRVWALRDLGELLGQLADETERRAADPASAAQPRLLLLYGLQRLRELRRSEDDFGYSRKAEEKTPSRLFIQVLKEGPPVGVFSMLWCDTLTNLQRALDRQTLREFDQRVLLQMSAADSSTMMDNPAAARLGAQRALFYAEDLGTIEKFRPYALPSVDWVRSLLAARSASSIEASTQSVVFRST